MDIIKKKEELKTKFQQVIAEIEKLVSYREQLKGQFSLLEEMEKGDKKESQGKKDGK